MSKVPPNIPDPKKPESIIKGVMDVARVVDGEIEFGHPLNPYDDQSTTLAGSGTPTVHNGSVQNIKGTWVEIMIGDQQGAYDGTLDEAIDCVHNLDMPVESASEPNVRWLVAGIQHDGTQQTRYEDLRVPANNSRALAGGKPATFGVAPNLGDPFDTIPIFWFADAILANEEEVFFTAQLPHTYKEGTNIECHVHWTPDVTGGVGETVRWELTYSWADVGETFPVVATIAGSTHYPADDPIVAGDHYMTEIGDLTSTGTAGEVSSMLVCGLKRTSAHADDDLEEEVGLLEVDFHFQVEGLGSDTEDSKSAYNANESQVISVRYDTDDTVEANLIPLRFNAAESLLVDDNHPLKVTLFFIPAVR